MTGTVKLLIERQPSKEQTLGTLKVKALSNTIFKCYTLELPDLNNEPKISCIPKGVYPCRKRLASESGSLNYDHILIENVPNRNWILIHAGNYVTQILGCIIVGDSHTDINKDGLKDVTDSRTTLRTILGLVPDRFELEII